MAKPQGNIHPAIIAATTTVQDDVEFQFGTDGDGRLIWETADANAHVLLLSLPAGGDPNIPIFVIGDDTALNKDLGLFDGITKPGIGILSDDATQASVYYSDRIDLDDGDNNILIGLTAGDSLTGGSGLKNVCIGSAAGTALTTSDNNILIGNNAGAKLTGATNVVIGAAAFDEAVGSNNNVIIGNAAADAAVSVNGNVVIGNVAVGAGTLAGDDNVVIGQLAGQDMTSANDNTFLGNFAGGNLTTGDSNVFLGHDAGSTLTTEGNQLVIDISDTVTPLIAGDFSARTVSLAGLTNGQTLTFKTNTNEHTLAAAATSTISNFIPAGSFVLAVSIRVTTAVTTDGADPDDFDIGTGADPNLYGSVISGAVNTTTTIADQTAVTPSIYASATDLIFDATGAENFTAGVIRATVHYIDITAAAS